MLIEKRRESILYITFTFLITWLCWGSLALSGIPAKENVLSTTLYLLGGMSPLIVAMLLPLLTKKEERSDYYKRFFNFKISIKWYLLSVISVLLMTFISHGFMLIFFNEVAKGLDIQPLYMVVPLFAAMIFGGGIEEFGWRGILVHNLQKKSPVLVSLGIGLIWACWHIPLFFIKGVGQYQLSFVPFLIMVIAYSFITTILYLRSGSVIPCIILHSLVNALGGLGFRYSGDQSVAYADSLIKLAVACAFFVILSRKKRSAEPEIKYLNIASR